MEIELYLIMNQALLSTDKCKERLTRLLRPTVTRQRANVDQMKFLGRPRDLQKLASDWLQTITAQPILIAVVAQMHLHAYALVIYESLS